MLYVDGLVKSRLTDENPAPSGIQCFYIYLISLDSGFRRNDGYLAFLTFYDFIIFKRH